MQEDDRAFIEALTTDAIKQPGHRLAGVDRVQQQAFLTRHQLHRRQSPGIGFAVAWREILVPQLDLETLRQVHTQQLGGALGQALYLRPLVLIATGHRDANDWQIRQCFAQGQCQAAVGSGAARGQHHGGEIQAGVLDLFRQFQPGTHIPQGAQRIGAANRHQIRLFAVAAQASGQGVQLLVGIVEVFHQLDLGIEQVQQQPIAIAEIVGVVGAEGVFQQRYAAQAQFGGNGGCLAHMVGLNRASGDQGVGTLRQSIGGQVLEFAQLVAAHGQWCQVIAFDVHVAAQPGRQAFELFQGGGLTEQVETVKAGKLLFDRLLIEHGSVLAVGDVWTIGTPI